uniref:Ovule protein n=1 Tax=Heterorhabditis bacteriophora TaxID=37862 RepID=A0A1I7X6I0_HETBA
MSVLNQFFTMYIVYLMRRIEMGNSNSSSKVRHKSESMEIKYTKPKEKIGKSKSMMELGSRNHQKRSITSIKEKDRPKLTLKDSRNSR